MNFYLVDSYRFCDNSGQTFNIHIKLSFQSEGHRQIGYFLFLEEEGFTHAKQRWLTLLRIKIGLTVLAATSSKREKLKKNEPLYVGYVK